MLDVAANLLCFTGTAFSQPALLGFDPTPGSTMDHAHHKNLHRV